MNFSDLLKACAYKLLPYVICIFIGLIVGGFVVYDHMSPKINEANAQLTAINNKYNEVFKEKELAKVQLALAKQKEPEKLYVKGEDKTEYVYIEKEKASDPDVEITSKPQEIKVSYNGETYNIPMQKTSESKVTGGTLKMTQSSSATLDVTDIVNREIANTILQKDAQIAKLEHEKKVEKRQGRQNTFWAATIGTTAGYLIAKNK